jgi:hypothetical protein
VTRKRKRSYDFFDAISDYDNSPKKEMKILRHQNFDTDTEEEKNQLDFINNFEE